MNKFFLVLIYLLFVSQDDNWKTWNVKEENIELESRISSIIDKQNEKRLIIEYEASIETELSLSVCMEIMENFSLHSKFFERTEKSELIKTYPSGEWLVYYYFTQPWPLPDGDSVTKFRKTVDQSTQQVIYFGVAAPDDYVRKDLKRMDINEVTYKFQELDDGSLKFTIKTRFSPITSAPKWMVNTWFPEGPIGMLERFVELAKTNKNK